MIIKSGTKTTIKEALLSYDIKFSSYAHHQDFGFLNHIIFIFAITFNNPITLTIPSYYIYYASSLNTKILLTYLIMTGITLIITLTMKKKMGRSRPIFPDLIFKKSRRLRKKESNNSMPSGDSTQAALFAIFCYFYLDNPYWLFIVPIVMYGRVHFCCHYFADTVVGAIIGSCVPIFFHEITDSIFKFLIMLTEIQ